MVVLAVDPEHLRRAAEMVRIVATDIDALVKRRGPGLRGPGQRPWESAAGLEAAARAWGDYLYGLAAGLDQTAARLVAAVDALVTADETAARLAPGASTGLAA